MADERVKCPYCSEEISASAMKCKYCQEWLDRSRSAEDDGSDRAKAVSYGIKDKERSDALVKVKFFILIVALIAITGIVVSVFEEPYIKLSAKAKEYWVNFILIPVWVIGLVGGGIKIAMDYYKEQ